MNEIAKGLWDLSLQWLKHADECGDINTTIAYTGMAEIALQQAQFAVNNPMLVGGAQEAGIPAVTAEQIKDHAANSPVPQAPTQGPKFWGAPQ